jgi:DNA ligase (NAD+)
MFSLQKYYKGEGKTPLEGYSSNIIETPKLDGAAISIFYSEGKVKQVLTRGDGFEGLDITNKFIFNQPVPYMVNNMGEFQVTGEIVAPKEIPNARNYAAGALNLKDTQEFLSRDLTFIAYNVQPSMSDSFSQDMYLLECLGFNVVTKQDWKEFPTDGRVFRVDNYEDFKNYGETSKHPKGAYAFKERSAGVPTTLLDVVWQTGKSGKVTPVAILDQIEIEGAKITQATLNNIKYIEDLGLEIGCTVTVERAGGIIPRVIKRI